jgi:hypothetical protein
MARTHAPLFGPLDQTEARPDTSSGIAVCWNLELSDRACGPIYLLELSQVNSYKFMIKIAETTVFHDFDP